jgi:hypothetical protein
MTTTTSQMSWRESASVLLSLLDSTDVDRNDDEVERACAAALQLLPVVNDDDAGDVDGVRRIIETTRLRSLIRLGRFDAALVAAGGRDYNMYGATSASAMEVAYALYRSEDYDACRKLCAASLPDGEGGGEDDNVGGGRGGSRGLMHVHAQALYRLGETRAADDVYRELLHSADAHPPRAGSLRDATDGDADADEREDALSNALANRIANHTPGIFVVNDDDDSSSDWGWLDGDLDLRRLLETYGRAGPTDDGDGGDNDDNDMQNYDLAYNLATYLLVSRSSRPRSSVVEAMNLLLRAEKSATSTTDDGVIDAFDSRLAERESNPIRANLAMSRMLLGGTSNETEAYRAYLTLLSRLGGGKKGRSKGSGGNNNAAIAEGNLLAAISNNIACLRDGKEGLSDSLKRIPTANSPRTLSASGDPPPGVGVVLDGSSTPLLGATPHQARFALYNRALLLARMGNIRECREALDMLRSSLRVSYLGDKRQGKEGGLSGRSRVGVPPNGSDGGGVKKKKKSKKGENNPAPAGGVVDVTRGGADEGCAPAAKPGSDVESIAWDARVDLLESELRRISKSSSSSTNDVLDAAIAKIDYVMTSSSSHDYCGALPYAKSLLLLHRAATEDPSSQRRSKAAIGTLESLPSSVRACPGAIVTMASLHDDAESAETALSSLGGDRHANLAMAELRVERGQYQAAVDLLRDIVEEEEDNHDKMEAMAILVTALSYTDPSKAEEYAYASLLPVGSSELSGEALEFMDIPRFSKQASLECSGGGIAGGSYKVRKLIVATSGRGRSNVW